MGTTMWPVSWSLGWYYGDVLVMPDYSFADSMNQQYGEKKAGKMLATHHYAGSWKNANGGEEAG